MRLICGFLHLDGRPAEATTLDAMAAAMVEPGLVPRIARRIDGPVALATLAFAEPPAALPQGDSGLLLAADVRLDEPEWLAEALATGTAPAGAGRDGTLLRTALERWGVEGVGRVLGDFAFAAWDPCSRTLLCARDSMGIRPFFFLHRPDEIFAFASLPRGLHAGGFAARELDEAYLLGNLLATHYGPERSLFRGVERLAPGGWLRVSAERIERDHHWKPDPASAGRRIGRPEEAAEELAALIAEAVRCRLPAAGPVAAHLSGGLDSSAITILAARMLRGQGRPLLGYSFLPTPQGGFDPDGERPYVEAVLRQESDIVWTPIRIGDPAAFVLPRMDVDQPLPCHRTDPEAQVFADAAARGAGMLLSGWGGDEGATFNGRGALAEALLAGRWRTLAGEVRARAAEYGQSPSMVLRGEVLSYLLPDAVWTLGRRLLGRPPPPPTLASAAVMLQRDAVAGVSVKKLPLEPDAVANRLRLLTGPHLSLRTEHWALTGARHGLAVAFPLLDRRVVAFALSLPSALFVRGGWQRRVFRDAMADVLPPEIRWRQSKLIPFPEFPVVLAAQRDGLLGQLAELREHPRVAGLFDLDVIERRVRALPAAEEAVQRAASLCEDRTTVAEAARLLRVVHFATYVQQHH